MIELLFADCNCQSLTKKFPLRCQKFPHSSQISSQISVGFANFVDMGSYNSAGAFQYFGGRGKGEQEATVVLVSTMILYIIHDSPVFSRCILIIKTHRLFNVYSRAKLLEFLTFPTLNLKTYVK